MARSILLFNKIRWYVIGSWLIWTVLVVIVLVKWYDIDIASAASDSIISNGWLLLSVFVLNNLLAYYHPRQNRMLYILLFIAALTWLTVSADGLTLLHIYRTGAGKEWIHQTMPVRAAIALLVNSATAGCGFMWNYVQEQQSLNERNEEIEKIAREAELYKLRQQLQPHFLFNSLNSINALTRKQPDEARKMVQQLSEFLRGTLKREENQFISLAEELDYLKLYLDIEKVRFGYRLRTEIDAAEVALKALLPPLLLQPLMENAIKFGLYGTTGEVTIQLHATMENNYLVISITNPFDPEMQAEEGTGFGLKSITRRLFLVFARNDLVEIHKTTNTFTVTFRIPVTNDK